MKIWVDDMRPAPAGYEHCYSVQDAVDWIIAFEQRHKSIEVIDIDHDAGDFAKYGGDYIKLLDWLEETHRNYPIHIHSMNPVGAENMRTIIRKNGWKEI